MTSPRYLLSALSVLVVAVSPSVALACSWTSISRVAWPQADSALVPLQTRVWINTHVDEPLTVRLIDTSTGADVGLALGATYSTHPTTISAETLAVYQPATQLRPSTAYTVHATNGDHTFEVHFTTAADATLPPPSAPPSDARYYMRTHGIIGTGADCIEPHNTLRFVQATAPTSSFPLLFTLDRDASREGLPIGALTAPWADPDLVHVAHSAVEADPMDNPCVTLGWVDPFGREGALPSRCTPDACERPGFGANIDNRWDTARYTPEQCDPVTAEDDSAAPGPTTEAPPSQTRSDDDSAATASGCAVAASPSAPTRAPLAGVVLAALCACGIRRRRAQR